jgi:hypothetical protein
MRSFRVFESVLTLSAFALLGSTAASAQMVERAPVLKKGQSFHSPDIGKSGVVTDVVGDYALVKYNDDVIRLEYASKKKRAANPLKELHLECKSPSGDSSRSLMVKGWGKGTYAHISYECGDLTVVQRDFSIPTENSFMDRPSHTFFAMKLDVVEKKDILAKPLAKKPESADASYVKRFESVFPLAKSDQTYDIIASFDNGYSLVELRYYMPDSWVIDGSDETEVIYVKTSDLASAAAAGSAKVADGSIKALTNTNTTVGVAVPVDKSAIAVKP